MTSVLALLLRRPPAPPPAEVGKSALGLALAIAAIGGLSAALGRLAHAPFLVLAPSIASSAVLVFAIPASPLAQPRAVIGGNLVSALAGLACGALLAGQPLLAGALAVALAAAAMLALGCLHPPGGAIAFAAALAAAAGHAPAETLAPIALGSALLVLSATAYVNLTGRTYPHRAQAATRAHGTADPAPADRVGFTAADLDKALAHYGELLDVSREDLDALFREVELQAHRRIHSQILCRDIMSRDVVKVDATQSAASALAYIRRHDLRTAPVVDEAGRVVGMVRRAELQTAGERPVASVLDPFVHKVAPATPIERLLPVLSSGDAHEVLVVDDTRRLQGIITQTDLLAVLYRAHIVEAAAAA